MATSFGALCTDFYINQKLALKMDLPRDRETILHFFDRMRKGIPSMNRFRRYDGELALESSRRETEQRWLALRRTSVRTGHVNPDSMEDAYSLHRLVLEMSPPYLTISPLDVDYLELLFGFDLECAENHDEVVYQALIEDSPLAPLLKVPGSRMLDVQPLFGLSLTPGGEWQAYFEVKTRTKTRRGSSQAYRHEPISVFLTIRRYGPVDRSEDLPVLMEQLGEKAETLATDRLVPHLLNPIARHIPSGSA
ncbi:MAG: hypothetical protein ACOCTI_01475 [Phycisphaeraceae bacterium]